MSRPSDPWQVGARVDRYRLDAELGRGGMGVVYAATDADTGRRVAIKTLLPNTSATATERFVREGLAQAAVDEHPNVLRVHSAGEAGGRRYLVMDLATGGDLGARLKGGPLPPLEAAAIARDLARGLAHVHARGITHRDLKPGNVLFDERGAPRLVDFGLAIVEGDARLTRSGNFVGTPAYMAPEQLDGGADARVDVYGLGAVLFHMLTGQPPFVQENRMALLAKLLTTPAPSAQELNPAVPEGIERVVRRCLAKRPAQRYATAARLADDLERVIAGEQVEAPPAGGGVALVVALAVAAFLLPITGGLAWSHTRPASGPAVAEAPVDSTTSQAPPASEVAPAPPAAPVAPRTLGLPTEERAYGCQWRSINGTPAWVSFRGALTLGPAREAEGVVTCPGRLSAITVWGGAGADTRFELEHEYPAEEAVSFEVTISPARELVVRGFEPERRAALFALLPEMAREGPGSAGHSWPGQVVREHLSNENVAKLLRLSLPWLADAAVPPTVRSTEPVLVLTAERNLTHGERVLLRRFDALGLVPESKLDASWTLDGAGLARCELNERSELERYPGLFGGVWWFLGTPEELAERKLGPQRW